MEAKDLRIHLIRVISASIMGEQMQPKFLKSADVRSHGLAGIVPRRTQALSCVIHLPHLEAANNINNKQAEECRC